MRRFNSRRSDSANARAFTEEMPEPSIIALSFISHSLASREQNDINFQRVGTLIIIYDSQRLT